MIGTVGARVDGRSPSRPARTPRPRRATCRRCSRACATRARHGRDGGVVARAATSTASTAWQFAAVCFTNLQPRPPRLPRLARRRTSRRRRRLFTRARTRRGRGERRRRRAAPSSRRARGRRRHRRLDLRRRRRHAPTSASIARGRSARDGTRATIVELAAAASTSVVDLPLVGSLQRRQRARGRRHRPCRRARHRRGGRRARATPSVVPGRFERVDAGQPFAVLVDYAHTPDALGPGARRGPPARRSPAAGCSCVFGCGGDRDPAQAPAHGRGGRRRCRRRRAHLRQPPVGGPAGDRRRGARPGSPARADVRVELDRRAAIRDALADGATRRRRGRSRARVTRPGQTAAGPHACRSTTASSRVRSWRRSDGADRGARSRRSPAARVVAGDPDARGDVVHHRLARRRPGACFVALRRRARRPRLRAPTPFARGARVAVVTDAVTTWRPTASRSCACDDAFDALARPRRVPRVTALARRRRRRHHRVGGQDATKDLTAAALGADVRGAREPRRRTTTRSGVPLTLLAAPADDRGARARDGRPRPRRHRRAVRDRAARPSASITNIGLAHAGAPRRPRRRRPGEGRAARGARRRRAPRSSTPATPRRPALAARTAATVLLRVGGCRRRRRRRPRHRHRARRRPARPRSRCRRRGGAGDGRARGARRAPGGERAARRHGRARARRRRSTTVAAGLARRAAGAVAHGGGAHRRRGRRAQRRLQRQPVVDGRRARGARPGSTVPGRRIAVLGEMRELGDAQRARARRARRARRRDRGRRRSSRSARRPRRSPSTPRAAGVAVTEVPDAAAALDARRGLRRTPATRCW